MKRLGENNIEITLITGFWKKRLFARVIEEQVETVTLPKDSTVKDVLEKMTFTKGQIGSMTIGGEIVSESFVLSDKDTLKVYPMMMGNTGGGV